MRYDGDGPWPERGDLAEHIDVEKDSRLADVQPKFGYILVDVSKMLDKMMLKPESPNAQMALIPESASPNEALVHILALKQLLDDFDGSTREAVKSWLKTGTKALTKLGVTTHQIEEIFEEKTMNWERTVQRWEDNAMAKGEARGLIKGEARGLIKGEARGMAKGRAEGMAKGIRESITQILQNRFGQESQRLGRLQTLTNLDTLRQLTTLAVTASTLDEFLEALP